MDFTLNDEQEALRGVARQLFTKLVPKERLEELEREDVRFDPALWRELAGADLLGIGVPTNVGGSGYGFIDVCIVLAEVGRAVAPVPAYATLALGVDPLARYGSAELQQRFLPGVVDGTTILTAALTEPGRSAHLQPLTTATRDGAIWRLDGAKELVPAAQLSNQILVPASTGEGQVGVFVVDRAAAGLRVKSARTTSREPYADLELDGCAVSASDVLFSDDDGGRLQTIFDRGVVGLCAMQTGVSEAAVQIAAQYTSEREQFGRPIGTFQAVQQRMADAFIDTEAIRWTAFYAAWLLTEGRPATTEAAIAKFWTSEAGARVASTTQQVHGGIGIDVTYPLFRYTLWAKQIELSLGSAPAHLARLGAAYTLEST
jgi:alkylation response protein AidB-like acyl-CoA dehydrogenase